MAASTTAASSAVRSLLQFVGGVEDLTRRGRAASWRPLHEHLEAGCRSSRWSLLSDNAAAAARIERAANGFGGCAGGLHRRDQGTGRWRRGPRSTPRRARGRSSSLPAGGLGRVHGSRSRCDKPDTLRPLMLLVRRPRRIRCPDRACRPPRGPRSSRWPTPHRRRSCADRRPCAIQITGIGVPLSNDLVNAPRRTISPSLVDVVEHATPGR